jgi:hypothetical protein
VFGPIAAAVFGLGIAGLGLMVPGYSHIRQTVSEIGEITKLRRKIEDLLSEPKHIITVQLKRRVHSRICEIASRFSQRLTRADVRKIAL